MPLCAVKSCANKPSRPGFNFSFHSIPTKDPNRLKLWLLALNMDPNTPMAIIKIARVCSAHFARDDCYEKMLPRNRTMRRFLKDTAIPSIGVAQRGEGETLATVTVVSDELVNPPDQGKGHMETPEGTGINKRRGKADDTKTEKLFVELEVTIDSDGEQSAYENVFSGLEEEEEEEEKEEEEEEEMEGVSDSDVEDGQQKQEEKENGEIENAENGQLLAVSRDDWQTEDVKDEELKQEEEKEEKEQIDEHDEDWEEEDEEEDSDSESDSEKNSNIKQSLKPRPMSTNKRDVRRTPLLCPDCGVTYTSFKHQCLKVHKMDCTGRTYACKYCLEQLATWEDKLNHEEQSHSKTEKDPYSCSECPQRFSSMKERRLHFKEHKKFICQTCHKQFPKSHKLRRHMLSHSSDKFFRCKVCSRAFAQASQLKCHTRIHTGERPYKCQLCPLQFNHNISLKNHVQRHHQKKEHHDDPDTDLLSQV